MAIYSAVPPPDQATAVAVHEVHVALHSLSIADSPARVTLSIPLHEATKSSSRKVKEPLRRDSMKRREALLKGKEGSRRRQRWENGGFFI